MDYKQSGVDIDAGSDAVARIKPIVKQTFNSAVLTELGSFGGLFALDVKEWQQPVLVSSTDGVGTKLSVAIQAGKYDTIGEDLVNHCVNDIFVHNAKPLFFLDYIGVNEVIPDKIEAIVSGMARGCLNHQMALIGGEMAEMPGIYQKNDFDLVGTIVGCVEKEKIVNGSAIKDGDVVIGFSANGLHTNGYSLARKILFESLGLKTDSFLSVTGRTVGEELLQVHKSYYGLLSEIAATGGIRGMAHITGGGIPGNLSRIIPTGLVARIDCSRWETPEFYNFIQTEGKVSTEEMYRVFNMGVGFITVVSETDADVLLKLDESYLLGSIVHEKRSGGKVEMSY